MFGGSELGGLFSWPKCRKSEMPIHRNSVPDFATKYFDLNIFASIFFQSLTLFGIRLPTLLFFSLFVYPSRGFYHFGEKFVRP